MRKMTIEQATADLEIARSHYRAVSDSIRNGDASYSYGDLGTASERVRDCERWVAAMESSEYAVPWELQVAALVDDSTNFEIEFRRNRLVVRLLSRSGQYELAFDAPFSFRMSAVNDELITAHPLWGRGLGFFGTYFVENSRWRREMEGIHATHDLYSPELWSDVKHALLVTRSSIFEVLASFEPDHSTRQAAGQ